MSILTTGVRYDVIAKDSASKVFRNVGDGADRLGGRLGKLTKTVAYAGAALAGGLAAGMAVSTEKAVKFEASMKKIQTQAGGTAKDVGVLSKQVLELGKSTQQGPEKLSEALYHLKSVGMDNADAMKALKTSSDLAAVGGADLEATTNALAGAWRTGIKGATSFGQSAATLNAIIGAGNMTMEDMVAALGTGILPTAKTFGLTFSQVGAALALFTDEGVDSASAATRLRMSISLLAAPSKASEKQLKSIGLTGNKLGEAMRRPDGIIGAIKLLKQHLDASGLSATKQAALLSRAFGGGKSSSAILSMVNNLDVLEKKQNQVNSSMGKFGPAVAAQRKTAAAQFALLKSNLDVFAIKTGDKLLPPLTKFVTYINTTVLPESGKVSRALMGMVPVAQIEKDFGTVEGLVGDFVRGFQAAPKKAKTFTLPVPTLKVPTTRIPDSLRRPLEIPSPTLKVATTRIPAGLAAPVAAKSQAQKMGEQLRGLISGGIGDAVGKIDWSGLGKTIGTGLGKAIDWVGAHGNDLTKRLAKAIGSVDWVDVGKSLGTLMLPMVIGMTDNLMAPLFTGDFWSKHWLDAILAAISVLPVTRIGGKVGELFGRIPWGKLGEVMDHVPWGRVFRWADWITNPLGEALGAAGRFVARLGTGFTSAFSRQFPRVAQFFSEQLLLLPVRLGDLGRLLRSKGAKLVDDLGNAMVKQVPLLGNRFVKAGLKYIGRYLFWQSGVQIAQGLLGGIGSGLADVGHWLMTHVVDPIVNWVKSGFGIHSPSTVFASIGGWLIAGLKAGALAGIAGIGKWLYGHVVSPVLGAFAHAGGWLYGKGSSLVGGLKSGAGAAMSGIGKWVSGHIKSPLTGAFSKAGGWLYSVGTSLMSGMLSGLQAGFSDVLSYLSTAKSSVSKSVGNAAKGVLGHLPHIPGFASGGLAPIGQTAWVGEKGPELMQVTPKGTRIYNARDSLALAGMTGLQVPGYASGTVSVGRARADIAAAQRGVTALDRRIAALRHAEATAHSKRARKRDQLAIMAAEQELKAARTRLTAANKELSNATAQAKRVQGIANTIQNGFLKTLQTGTAAGIASAVKSMNTKLQAAGAGSLVAGNLRTSTQLQSLATRKASIVSRIATANQYASDQAGALGDFLGLDNIPSSSISSLVSRMQAKQKTASSFAAEVAGLSKRGLDKTLLSQLADAGPGSQLAALLSKASAGDIAQLNKVAASQSKLTVSFGRTMADAMYDSGAQAGKGFLTGLQAQEKALQAEMNRLAEGMVKTIEHKLGIHSPSTVTRDRIGKPFALGAAAGVRLYTPHAAHAAQRMADTMAAVRARPGAVLVGAGAGGSAGQVVHHTEYHYEINPRTADFTPRDLEATQRLVEARHRVGRPR